MMLNGIYVSLFRAVVVELYRAGMQ